MQSSIPHNIRVCDGMRSTHMRCPAKTDPIAGRVGMLQRSHCMESYLEADDRPAILEDGEGVSKGWVDHIQGCAIGGLVVYPDPMAQHPEVVAMHVEGMLLSQRPVAAQASIAVVCILCKQASKHQQLCRCAPEAAPSRIKVTLLSGIILCDICSLHSLSYGFSIRTAFKKAVRRSTCTAQQETAQMRVCKNGFWAGELPPGHQRSSAAWLDPARASLVSEHQRGNSAGLQDGGM